MLAPGPGANAAAGGCDGEGGYIVGPVAGVAEGRGLTDDADVADRLLQPIICSR